MSGSKSRRHQSGENISPLINNVPAAGPGGLPTRPHSAGKTRAGVYNNGAKMQDETVVYGPAISQTQTNLSYQLYGPDGQPIPGYARPKSAGSIRRSQLNTSTSSPVVGNNGNPQMQQHQFQHQQMPQQQHQQQLGQQQQSLNRLPTTGNVGYSEQTKRLYYSGGATNQMPIQSISRGNPSDSVQDPRPSSAGPRSSVTTHLSELATSTDKPHGNASTTSANTVSGIAQLQLSEAGKGVAAHNINIVNKIVNNNDNNVSVSNGVVLQNPMPTISDTKKVINVVRPQSATERIRNEINNSLKYKDPKDSKDSTCSKDPKERQDRQAAEVGREGGEDPLGADGDRIRKEELLAKEDDDDMDGYKPVHITALESRSHPEISTTFSQMSGIDRLGSQDSLITDELVGDLGLTTIPNQFCTVRDALELKKLLLLSNVSRGGMVPSSTAVMDMYMVGKVVGVGSYGKVRAAWHRLTGSKVAIKTYDKSKLKDPAHWKRVSSEIRIMEQVSHPRIARLYEAVETPKRMHLIMECLEGGDLCSYVKQKRRLSEDESRSIFFQVLQAIDHLHTLGVAHRDVKLENVLFVDGRDVKLIDFGFSTVCQADKKLKVFCGTPSYMAPEIVRRTEYDGKPVDIWSLGIFLYALLCGCFPFRAKSYPDLYRRIARGTFSIPDELSYNVKDLLSNLLHIDVDRRITSNVALRHPWLQSCFTSAPDIGKLRLETRTLISDRASDDIDEEALLELNTFGIPREDLIRLVMAKVHSSMTTVYYLLLEIVDRRRKLTMNNSNSNKARQTIVAPQYNSAPSRRAHSAGATRSGIHGSANPTFAVSTQQQPQQGNGQQPQPSGATGPNVLYYSSAASQQPQQQHQQSQQQFLYSSNNAGAGEGTRPKSASSTSRVQQTQRPLSAHAGRIKA
jgi:serine/threonine protein kinase